MAGFTKSKLASGVYGNATEVIRDAVRRLQAEDRRVAAWQAAIKVGDDQLNRGDGIAHTLQVLNDLNDITQSAINTLHSGAPIGADALP